MLQQANEQVQQLETALENAKSNYERELKIMQERKELEREKVLVEVDVNTKQNSKHKSINTTTN
ncbi:hypothetical protein [Ureibacillus xyleni]|uniref:hypothetical protein n=1 Tax=Ureibacillus xyleni TaxID=614648 RepID=UPI000BE29007|nr:hypothetical protein [Ureibacillus xyleni]